MAAEDVDVEYLSGGRLLLVAAQFRLDFAHQRRRCQAGAARTTGAGRGRTGADASSAGRLRRRRLARFALEALGRLFGNLQRVDRFVYRESSRSERSRHFISSRVVNV